MLLVTTAKVTLCNYQSSLSPPPPPGMPQLRGPGIMPTTITFLAGTARQTGAPPLTSTPRSRFTSSTPRTTASTSSSLLPLMSPVMSRHRSTPSEVPSSRNDCSTFTTNPMYSFGDGFVGDQATLDLQDIVAMQATAVNDLQQLTSSLQREASALKAIAEEQQGQLDEMREQLQSNGQLVFPNKERLPRRLSNLVQTLYTSLDISYHVDERFDSEHNRRVRCELYRESRSQEEEFGKQMIERAVSRLYEKLRRSWKEGQEGMFEKVMSDGRKRRRAARRRRLYIRRSKYVISTAEREKWQQIDSRYMTDEYSSDEDSSLSLHHPTWRSVELNELTNTLDSRYSAHSSTSQQHHPPARPRVPSSPSQSVPPVGAPEWAVAPA